MTVEQRFWTHVQPAGECWLWIGSLSTKGYGRYLHQQAHRLAYEWLVGPIPTGLTLDHLCRNRACVRPSHLEPVTNRENILRGETLPAANVQKTHCRRGHPYTPENTILREGGRERVCRACNRERQRRAYWRDPESERKRSRDRYLAALEAAT